jgi:hypothetical protein
MDSLASGHDPEGDDRAQPEARTARTARTTDPVPAAAILARMSGHKNVAVVK